jgi:hypothetical protein
LFSQEKWDDLFPVKEIYFKNWGWYAGIGGNYTIPTSGKSNMSYGLDADTSSAYLFSPVGKLGGMLEGGAFYMFDNPYVAYVDGGIRVNWFSGKEKFDAYQIDQQTTDTLSMQSGDQQFSMANVSLRLNANNAIQVSKYGFIQNTLGVNFDYNFYHATKVDPENYSFPAGSLNTEKDPSFQMQFHYQIAYGFRLDLMHYMIIGLDTPILTFVPWENGKPSIAFFHSSYLPVTLSVRFMFLQKSNRPDCQKPPPLDMNKKRKKARMF